MDRGALPRGGRRYDIVRASLSVVVLVLIVVAAPFGLYELGGLPFFHLDLGTAKEVFSHRSASPSLISHWLLRSALLLAWISWAWVTICVAVEARSKLTGRPPVRIPASHAVQSIAAFLVGATLALSSVGRIGVVPAPGQAGTSDVGLSWPASAPVGAHARSSESTPPLRVIDDQVVEAESVGTSLGRTSPNGSVALDSFESGDRLAGTPHHLVMPRETLWSIAEDRLGSPLRWREIAELNYDVPQDDRGALTLEHWIRPGWRLELPTRAGRPGSFSIGYRDQVTRALNGDPSVGHEPETGGFGGLREPRTPPMPVGGGVLGAGVVGLLDRMRRVQQRHRREGAYIRLPERAQRQFERRLRLGEGREIVRDVEVVLRMFTRALMPLEIDAPTVLGLTVHPDRITLMVDRIDGVDHLPPSFTVEPDDRALSIDRADLPVDGSEGGASERSTHPAPLLVTVGQGSGGVVMVNLESLGTLLVNGDETGCEGVVRALALELATSKWSGRFDLETVGFGAELERFDRVTSVDDLPSHLDSLLRRRLTGENLLSKTRFNSFAQARSVDASGVWDPVVVICSPSVAGPAVSELLEVASDPRVGIAVVASGATGQHVVHLSGPDRTPSLELLGAVVRPQQVEAAELRDVTSLVDTAMNRQSVLLSEEPYLNLPVPMPLPGVQTEDGPRPPVTEWSAHPVSGPAGRRFGDTGDAGTRSAGPGGIKHEVEVAVLGEIEVRGAARSFTRAWAKELVVYLALHPNGASNDAWATALWPDRLMAPSSLHSTASVARRSLGQARDGGDHLPRSHGRLALSGTVGTDWDRFVAHADSNDTGRWQAALELVRGRPLEGLRSSDWPILEGIGPAIEAAVVDLSGRLAGSRLAGGDSMGAEWAARKGLLASPYDERLYRMLMRAADLAGNPAGVEAAMSELIRLVADDIEPFDSVHPSTMALYRSLTRRRDGTSRMR